MAETPETTIIETETAPAAAQSVETPGGEPQPAESPESTTAPETAAQPAEPQPKPTRILLIRHGVNDYVKTHRLAGRCPGVHLNDEGIAQAEALAERLVNAQIAAVYSSPLERAQETAGPLARRLNLSLQIENGIMETDCGEWSGQKLEDLSKTDLWKQVQVYPSGIRFPGGESFAEIQARMVAALEALRVIHANQTIAVVSHADPIKLAIAFYAGMPLDMFQRLVIAPASITEIEFSTFRPIIARVNDCAHIPVTQPSL